jgi:glycosyltransferase involved in cell wall biosynthesis
VDIDLYANDGSPIGIAPPDIYGRGVGGAELSMMTWAETMAARGHTVRVYNSPSRPDTYDGVVYHPQNGFNPSEYRDVFIVYRSPNPYLKSVNAGVKIHWSTDQYTIGDFAKDVFPYVDRVVCISPYHVNYHRNRYGVEDGKIGYIDLGVRLKDYPENVEKVPGRCIFCSVPDRGLNILRVVWPKIKEKIPHANLIITSDYTLWGAPPLNHQFRLEWLNLPDVTFAGKLPRHELCYHQMTAQIHAFPCSYEELFCISAAECQTAGAVPVTSDFGALPTTNQWGTVLVGHPMDGKWQTAFVSQVVELLEDDSLGTQAGAMAKQARSRFDWDVICGQWEHLIETGEFAN